MSDFSHLDDKGNVRMVDVTEKVNSLRVAKAEGRIYMRPETIAAIQNDELPKGSVLTTAKVAGIQAAKKTAEIIPMCPVKSFLCGYRIFNYVGSYIDSIDCKDQGSNRR